MSETPPGPSGTPPAASGDSDKDKVAYETHQKLLGEKKKLAEKMAAQDDELARFRAAEDARKTKELEDAKNYDQIQKNLKDELAKKDAELTRYQTERTQAKKLDAFIQTLGSPLERKFWGLVDIDQIVVDPATGDIDEMSVSKYVDLYRKTYPETVLKKAPGMPNQAPQGAPNGKMSIEDWKAIKDKTEKWAAVREGRVILPK